MDRNGSVMAPGRSTAVLVCRKRAEYVNRMDQPEGTAVQISGLTTGRIRGVVAGKRLSPLIGWIGFRRRNQFNHAGENLATVLAQRAKELGPPIQMCDALSRNLPKEFRIVVVNCIAHAAVRIDLHSLFCKLAVRTSHDGTGNPISKIPSPQAAKAGE